MAAKLTIPVERKIGYAIANFGKSLQWNSTELFLLFFLTDIAGLGPTVAGTILFLSLLWDGVTDPMMGHLIDKYQHRIRTYSTYLLYGAPITAIFFVLSFTVAPVMGPWLIAYFVVIGLLYRTFYSIVDVPHNAMLASLTHDPKERNTLAGMRIFFSGCGGLAVSFGLSEVIDTSDTALQAFRFTELALICAVVATLLIYVCWWSVKDIELQNLSLRNREHRSLTVNQTLWFILTDKALLIAFALTALTSFSIPFFTKNVIYLAKYHLDDQSLAGNAFILMTLMQACVMPFWTFLARNIGKVTAAQTAHLIIAGCFLAFYLLPLTIASFYTLCAVIGVSIGGIYMLNWSVLPDAIDGAEARSGDRPEASVFGLYTCANKIFIGLSAAVIGLIYGFIGFEPNQDQNDRVLEAMNHVTFIMPAIGSLLSVYLFGLYSRMNRRNA